MTHAIPRRSSVRRRWLAAFALVVANVMIPSTAHAQLAPLYNELVNTIQQTLVNKLMAKMGMGIEGAVEQAGAATRAEVLKGTIANKNVQEGLASYREQIKLNNAAHDAADALQQPATTCQAMAVQGGLGNSVQAVRARVSTDQSRVMTKVASNASTHATIETAHEVTNATLCTAAEQARGICKVNPTYSDLAGADQNAAFLFQNKDGSPTYDGTRSGAQAAAADSYITRVVAGLPPEQLHGADFAKQPQSRGYVELGRRYSAVLSLASYSLNQIKEAHTAQIGLGNDTSMANAPGFAPKPDMSMLEAVQRFVAVKFSPESLHSAQTANNESVILRDMAQTQAFKLWIEHQTLLQDSRTEAMLAAELAMATERTLRPQLEAQRIAATRAAH